MTLCPICHLETKKNDPITAISSVSCPVNSTHRFIRYYDESYYMVFNAISNILEIAAFENRTVVYLDAILINEFDNIEACELIKYINFYLKLKLFI